MILLHRKEIFSGRTYSHQSSSKSFGKRRGTQVSTCLNPYKYNHFMLGIFNNFETQRQSDKNGSEITDS